jgi:hypothetical protein
MMAPPPALPRHLPRGELSHEEDAFQVHAQHAVEILLLEVEEFRRVRDARVRHDDVDATERVDHGVHRLLHVVLAGDVAADAVRIRRALVQLRGLAVDRDLVHVREHDLGAFPGERGGAGEPDALGRARDEGDLVAQAH